MKTTESQAVGGTSHLAQLLQKLGRAGGTAEEGQGPQGPQGPRRTLDRKIWDGFWIKLGGFGVKFGEVFGESIYL